MGVDIKITKEVLLEEIDQEVVLFHPQTQRYFALEGVGVLFWKRLSEGLGVEDILAEILEAYEVDEATLRRDMALFLQSLEKESLIKVEKT
jgi:hypothetical protein